MEDSRLVKTPPLVVDPSLHGPKSGLILSWRTTTLRWSGGNHAGTACSRLYSFILLSKGDALLFRELYGFCFCRKQNHFLCR